MIIYQNDVIGFRTAVDTNRIVNDIDAQFSEKFGKRVQDSERRAWNNSLRFMETALRLAKIPDDGGVLIEYNIPSTSKRIDFIVSGHDEQDNPNFVIIELKQWDKAEATDKEDLVIAYTGRALREVAHPSYQAYSYKKYLMDMNEAVYSNSVNPFSCAYLHNFPRRNPEPILSPQYMEIVKDTPVFFTDDIEKLEDFLRRYVGKGQGKEILYQIENGKIRPSRKFVEYVSSMFDGNQVYTLLDEQKVAHANIIRYASTATEKTTIIVNGGPGTGKSVVAMNAFADLLRSEKNIKFVAPNASFRSTIVDMLAHNKKNNKKRLNAIFSGSGAFYASYPNEFDVLVVDEAHRLKKKGAYMYRGISQVEDVIKASLVNVFFIDDNQRIRPDDEGTVEVIKEVASRYQSQVVEVELMAQFRCAGAEGFLNWVDHNLQIRETANFDGWDGDAFEFSIVEDPHTLTSIIAEKRVSGFHARLLAGFAWPWTSEKDGNSDAEVPDVQIPEHDFQMPWNSRRDQYSWASDNKKSDQIGCVHTSQGLEFDYVGVIIGNDLRYNPLTGEVYANSNDYYDTTGKKGLKDNPAELTRLIKNIYKVLLSRGMKGCFVYCRDTNLQEYLKGRLKGMNSVATAAEYPFVGEDLEERLGKVAEEGEGYR